MSITDAHDVLKNVAALLTVKNEKYGNGVFDSDIFGTPPDVALLARIGDKIRRLKTLLNHEQDTNGETIEDTINDLIGYLAIYQALRRGAK